MWKNWLKRSLYSLDNPFEDWEQLVAYKVLEEEIINLQYFGLENKCKALLFIHKPT
jgi:hypothetical protein